MGCSQSKSAAVVEPPPTKAAAAASALAVSQQNEEQSLLHQAATTAATSREINVLPKEGLNSNNEAAIIDTSKKENAPSPAEKEKEETNDETTMTTMTMMTMTTLVTPVATSEATLSDAEKEEEYAGSSRSVAVVDDDDDGKVVEDAPTDEISTVEKVASSATETAQESTVTVVVVQEEKAAKEEEETGSTTEKENNAEETTPQEKGALAEACAMQSESESTTPTTDMEMKVNHHHQPVVKEETKILEAEMPVLQADPEMSQAAIEDMKTLAAQPVVKEEHMESSSLPGEAIKSVQVDDELPVVTDDVEVKNEEEVSSEQNEKGKSIETGMASASNVAITEMNETTPSATVEATPNKPELDTLVHVASSIVREDENEKSKPECEAVIPESVNVKEEEVETDPSTISTATRTTESEADAVPVVKTKMVVNEYVEVTEGAAKPDTGSEVDSPVEDAATVVDNRDAQEEAEAIPVIRQKTQTTTLSEKGSDEMIGIEPFVQHDVPGIEAVDIKENWTTALTKSTEPPSLLPTVITAKEHEEITPEIVSKQESPAVTIEEKCELVISESVEVKEEMKVAIVETKTPVASDAVDANKIHEEELHLHGDQETSTVDGAENKGGPLCENEEVPETVVSVESPALSAATETEGQKPTDDGETSAVDTEDKPEHIPSECGGVKEEVVMPVEHEKPDLPIATNATETASTIGKLEAGNVQVLENSEPCAGVEQEELTAAQPEQTRVAYTTSKDIEIEEPALTSGDGEAPMEKVDYVAESDDKLVGSEIDHPGTDTVETLEECAEGSAPVDMKVAGGSDELKTPAIEEQAACLPPSKEGTVVGAKTLSSTDQVSIEIPPKSPGAASDTAQMMADEASDKMGTGEDIKKPGVVEDLEYSESHVSLSESSSSVANEEPTETPAEEEQEEEPEDDEPILELKNVTAMTRVLIPEDQRHHSVPIASRWGWPTGLGTSSGTNMTGIGSASVASKSPEKDGSASKTGSSESRWGLQTGLLGFTKSTSEAEENGQAKSELLAKDAEVSKPLETKDEPLSETKERESSSTAAAVRSTAATTSPTGQQKKNDPPPKKKKLTDIEKARLFAASVLLESEHVVVKEEKEAAPKRFGSWF